MEKEGVVKYNLQHQKDQIDLFIDITDLNQIRRNLFDKKFIGRNTLGIGYGNISIRIKEEFERFLITGTQTGEKRELSRNDFSIITNYDFENFLIESYGNTPPSSEALTHAAIYELFSEVNAVIHIHSELVWSFMMENNFLKTKIVEYGTREMVTEIKRIFQSKNISDGSVFAMSGHTGGIIAFGKNLEAANRYIDNINYESTNINKKFNTVPQ
jgi:ribulose-5-phosphate 4-epimerase/fuculose-1-phosphate aldolase